MAALLVLALAGCQTGEKVNDNTDKKALLVVSFGSSFIENRAASIDATETVLAEAFAGYDPFRAFTSEIIIDIYRDRDGVEIKNVAEQIEEIYKAGYGEVLVVPTHVINGIEYDEMIEALGPFTEKFAEFRVSKPLLSSTADYGRVIDAVMAEIPETDDKTAVVFMGHGTHHDANSAYAALDYHFKHMDYSHVFVGTVEGSPEFDAVAADVEAGGYEKVILMPLMIVAGDHAHNDMAGDKEDSWKVMFKSMGYDVEIILKGMGELESVQNMFVQHAKEALALNAH